MPTQKRRVVYLADEDWSHLSAGAEYLGVSISEFIRQWIGSSERAAGVVRVDIHPVTTVASGGQATQSVDMFRGRQDTVTTGSVPVNDPGRVASNDHAFSSRPFTPAPKTGGKR